MSSAPALFQPIKLGRLTLQHRVVLAPLTRFRAHASHVPGPQAATYYSQRASVPGTLLVTEATLISHNAGGYAHVPGIYTDEQIEGWKKITDAVHARGSYIFLQLWALGRTADIKVLEKQVPPSPFVAPSAIAITGSNVPRPLTGDEIRQYIAAYAQAAHNAVHRAGFDGVEVHSANGYLPDQFLQTPSNKRTDEWGGDEEGRTRFTREVVDAIADAVGEDRVAIRISPWAKVQDMGMADPRPTFAYLAAALRDKHPKIAYLHVIEPRSDDGWVESDNNDFLREIWKSGKGGEDRIFISAGGHSRESALQTAEEKDGLVAFGRLFIPNPDLPSRLQKNTPLSPGDRSTYYQPGNLTPLGYTDWPFADGHVEELHGRL